LSIRRFYNSTSIDGKRCLCWQNEQGLNTFFEEIS
jgi:hypothetical protein